MSKRVRNIWGLKPEGWQPPATRVPSGPTRIEPTPPPSTALDCEASPPVPPPREHDRSRSATSTHKDEGYEKKSASGPRSRGHSRRKSSSPIPRAVSEAHSNAESGEVVSDADVLKQEDLGDDSWPSPSLPSRSRSRSSSVEVPLMALRSRSQSSAPPPPARVSSPDEPLSKGFERRSADNVKKEGAQDGEAPKSIWSMKPKKRPRPDAGQKVQTPSDEKSKYERKANKRVKREGEGKLIRYVDSNPSSPPLTLY